MTTAAKKQEKTYTVWINKTGKTLVLGTKHPNVNIWLMPDIPTKLTDLEVEHSDLAKFHDVVQVTDAASIKKAVRPDEAQRNVVKNIYDLKEAERKKREKEEDTTGFNERPKEAKPVVGIPS